MTASAPIPTRPLGDTGLSVPAVSLGTVKFGRAVGMKYPRPYQLPTDDTINTLLDIALDHGVTLLDTAPAYMTSEERLGDILAIRSDKTRWQITTKAGEEFDPGTGSVFDFTPEAITTSLERSLRRLRIDRVDCLLLHSDGIAEADDGPTGFKSLGTYDALAALKARGLTRTVGVSAKTTEGTRRAIAHTDVVMLAHNPADTTLRPEIELAGQHGIGVMVKKALASGHAAAAGTRPNGPTNPIADALAASLSLAAVSTVVIGTINPAHLASNIDAAGQALAAQDAATEP